MHYYRHEIGHFRAATAALNNQQRYAYMEMIWTYYDKEKPLPDNPRKLALRIGATQEDIELILEIYFDLEDDGWHNKTCDKVLDQYYNWIGGRVRGGLASAAARAEEKLNTSSTRVQPNQLTTNQLTTKDKKKGADAPGGNSSSSAPIPYQAIIDLYHEILPMLPRVVKLTEKRRSHIRARWQGDAQDLDWWKDYFQVVTTSKFLTGQANPTLGRPVFRADIDFLIREDVMTKTQEGKYHRA